MPGARGAGPRDADRVVALWSALMAHHRCLDSHWHTAAGAAEQWGSFLGRLLEDPDALVLVWEEPEGDLLGFCAAQIGRAPPILVERTRCEITDLFVREDARRRGIAAGLVRAALDWCTERGVERVVARVASQNAQGQAFWRALGFGDFVDELQRRL